MSTEISQEDQDSYTKIKASHTCKGERYLSGCTACWINRHETEHMVSNSKNLDAEEKLKVLRVNLITMLKHRELM